MAAQQRAAHVSAMAFESKHRHIVFTIPKELRHFFLKDRSLLEGFFTVSRNVLASLFNDCKYRKMKNRFKKNHICKKTKHKSKYLYKDTRNNIIFGAQSVGLNHSFAGIYIYRQGGWVSNYPTNLLDGCYYLTGMSSSGNFPEWSSLSDIWGYGGNSPYLKNVTPNFYIQMAYVD